MEWSLSHSALGIRTWAPVAAIPSIDQVTVNGCNTKVTASIEHLLYVEQDDLHTLSGVSKLLFWSFGEYYLQKLPHRSVMRNA